MGRMVVAPPHAICRRALFFGALGTPLPRLALASAQPTSPLTLTAISTERALLPGAMPATPLVAYDGLLPGPLLRARQGEPFALRLANALDEPTAIDWYGVRAVSSSGATPRGRELALAPGGTMDVVVTPPNAGTFFYRASSPKQAERGLAGAFIVDERTPPPFDRDVALLLDDFPINPDGRLSDEPGLRLGNVLTVNGVIAELVKDVGGLERIRVRIINAASLRPLAIRAEGATPLIIALDGQPTEPFVPERNTIVAAPGNRVDALIDMPAEPLKDCRLALVLGERSLPMARFVVSPEPWLRDAPLPLFSGLPPNLVTTRLDLARALRVPAVISGPAPSNPRAWSLDSGHARGGTTLFKAKRGATVVLHLSNRSSVSQALHVHGHVVRPLDRLDDGVKPYLLDTLPLAAGEDQPVAFVADNPGRWPIESSSPRLAAMGVRAWFEVG